jgi:hypothetical protein
MRHALDCGLCCGLAECDCMPKPVNLYQRIWGGGYAERRRKIMATHVNEQRKLAALNRLWARMVKLDGGQAPRH